LTYVTFMQGEVSSENSNSVKIWKLTPSAVRSLMDGIHQRWNSPRPLNTLLHITPRCAGISRHFWGVIFLQLAAYPNQTSAAVFLIRKTRERSGSLRLPRDGDSAAVVRPIHDGGSAPLHSTVDSGQRPRDGGTRDTAAAGRPPCSHAGHQIEGRGATPRNSTRAS
jgi:hypothetical protein